LKHFIPFLSQDGVSCELIDLQTLLPWDVETVAASVSKTGRLVISHEAPITSGFGAEVAAKITERAFLKVGSSSFYKKYKKWAFAVQFLVEGPLRVEKVWARLQQAGASRRWESQACFGVRNRPKC
jgi:transketolase C-terminal domain/subunit